MAFPQVEATENSVESSSTTLHTVDLPSGIQAGEILIVFFSMRYDATITWPDGWIQFFKRVRTGANFDTLAIAWKKATGSEGSSITVTTSSGRSSAHISYRISGAEDPEAQAPEAGSGSDGYSSSCSTGSCTPTGGAKDYLWIAVKEHNGIATVSAYPENFTDGENYNSYGSDNVNCGVARRELNASTHATVNFTLSASAGFVGAMVAVHPSGVQTNTKTWGTDALFKKLGITKTLNVDAAFQKQDIPKTYALDVAFQKSLALQRQVDVLFKKFDILIQFGVDVDFLKQDIIRSFALDARFGAIIAHIVSRQIDVLFKKLDTTKTFAADVAFKKSEIPLTFGVDANLLKRDIQIQREVDALFKRLGVLKTCEIDADFLKRDIIESFAVDAYFGALLSHTVSRQIDALLKKLDVTRTFGVDVYFGAVGAETTAKTFALDVIFAYKVRLPELWLDENGKIVLNLTRPYTWVGS